MRIGIDAGGTFTDFVVLSDGGGVSTFKLRSNPKDPAEVILRGIEQAAGARTASVSRSERCWMEQLSASLRAATWKRLRRKSGAPASGRLPFVSCTPTG